MYQADNKTLIELKPLKTLKTTKSVFSNNKVSEFSIDDYSEAQPQAIMLRKKVIEWLYNVNITISAEIQTFYGAVYLFDQFLGKFSTPLNILEINLYSAVCYYISVKFVEVEQFDINFLKHNILSDKFEIDELKAAEVTILKTLGFRIYYSTVETFTQLFLKKVENPEKCLLLEKAVTFINCIAIFYEELFFERKSSELAIITLKASIMLLYYERKLSSLDVDNLQDLLRNELIKFDSDIDEIARLLFQQVLNDEDGIFKNLYDFK
jgi:hypothetical protein